MPACRVCRSSRLQFIADFGSLAITNQFVSEEGVLAYRQPMSWHQCLDCRVVQLTDVPPVDQIRCRFSWLTYREPEQHLDETAAAVLRLAKPQTDDRVIGLTKEDLPLMNRLGPRATFMVDPVCDLKIADKSFGVETIQSRWTVERARQVLQRSGAADILVARYVLEHAHDAAEFLAACRTLLKPNGILVIEVPDCAAAFREADVTVLWEEHAQYFTEQSLQRAMALAGFEMLHFQRVTDPMEDRLVWIGRPVNSSPMDHSFELVQNNDADLKAFQSKWAQRRQAFRSWAESIRRDHGRLAVFGAGHRACTLIDSTNIAEFIDCIVDDTKEKQQLKFPAGELPIYGSAALVERGIRCCLLVVNPGVEDRIIERNSQFIASGGFFVSYYPGSSRALRLP